MTWFGGTTPSGTPQKSIFNWIKLGKTGHKGADKRNKDIRVQGHKGADKRNKDIRAQGHKGAGTKEQWRTVRLLVGEAQFFFTHLSMPQLERSFKGGKICLWRGQNFWVGLVFTKFSVDIHKKRSSLQYGLLFSEVSVGFQKKATILKLLQG